MIRKLQALPALVRSPYKPVVHSVPGMANVPVQKDLVYRGNGRTGYKLDVYHPLGDQREPRKPTVFLVHGGAKAFSNCKNTRPFVSWGQLFAASGISAVAFNWDCPEILQVLALVDYVRQHAEQLHIDPDRLGVFVFSGGVEVVVPAVMKGTLGPVRCLVAYYGNLKRAHALLEETTTKLVPTLIVKAKQDEFMPANSSDSFVELARAKGAEIQQLTHSTGGHAFDVRNDDAQSHEIIERTIGFVKQYLEAV